jgi:hypothetical protein
VKQILLFLIYFHSTYIVENDFLILNSLGKTIVYPAWFAKYILLWCISPLFILDYIWKQSNTYKKIIFFKKLIESK